MIIDDAVDLIGCGAVKKAVESTSECIGRTRDLLLACNLKAVRVEKFPEVDVCCEYGNLLVYAGEKDARSAKFKPCLKKFQQEIEHIHNLQVHTGIAVPADVG
ncbi:hypothetical protein [Desulfobacula sp.]